MKRHAEILQLSFVTTLALFSLGCSNGDIGRVQGTVTIDGQPLPNATIEYFPSNGGGASAAMTDANGNFELRRGRDTMGAVIGEHLVKIYTAGAGAAEGDYGSSSKETVPAKYNVHSDLKRTVNGGSNTHNFELDSDGEIIQPPGMDGGRY